MAFIKKAYHTTAEGQVHYRFLSSSKSGTELPPIVLLHMSASSSASMEKMMLLLADLGHDTYAPDYPGFGSSSPPATDPPDTAFYCHTVLDFCKALKLDKFHLFGHHSGACIAVEMAVLFPSNVLSICIVGPVFLTLEERMAMKTMYFETFNEPMLDGSHLMKTWKHLESIGDDVELRQRETLDNLIAWKGRNQIYFTIWNQDCMALIKKVACPILALSSENDVLIPYFHRVKELRPDAGAEVVPGRAGDFEPDKSAGEILEFYGPFLQK